MTGQVRSLPPGKMFGFIRSDNKDYFFHREDFTGHWDDLVSDFKKNRSIKVEFERMESPKGLRAWQVKRTDYPN